MNFLTIEDVELMSVGMEWPTMTGAITITFEHLADAMEAANDDPHIQPPRIKLGHTDPRFGDGPIFSLDDPALDGEPAFGRAVNLRLENDGATLVADFVEVPEWLAEAMPSAYPNRSVEGAFFDAQADVKTNGGKTYSLVLTAVALLGIRLPAIADLDDLERLMTTGPEEGEVEITDGEVAAARIAAAAKVGGNVAASADIEQVRSSFYNDFAVDDRYWWWPRSIWTDPNELIVDDDEGHLYRVPFTSDDDGNISFGEPVKVKQTFVDVESNEPVAARQGAPVAVYATRKEAGRNEDRPVAAREDVDMKSVRERLGLPEDASEEEINAALDEVLGDGDGGETDPSAETETDPSAEGDGDADPDAVSVDAEPVAATTGEGPTVTVDRGVWEDVQRQAREGAAARTEQLAERRERILDEAVQAGKIAPASRDAWRTKLQAAADATEAEIDALPAGLIPVSEVGAAKGDPDASEQAQKVLATFGGRRRAG